MWNYKKKKTYWLELSGIFFPILYEEARCTEGKCFVKTFFLLPWAYWPEISSHVNWNTIMRFSRLNILFFLLMKKNNGWNYEINYFLCKFSFYFQCMTFQTQSSALHRIWVNWKKNVSAIKIMEIGNKGVRRQVVWN